jgi:cell division protein FtsQ
MTRLRTMRSRNKLICLAALPIVGLLGWLLLLRDSAFFAVQQVQLVGLSHTTQPIVATELLAAARGQTTTNFSVGTLRASVARYTLIADVSAQTQVPHGVRIEVRERRPIARLRADRRWFLLDASGLVITGADLTHLALLRSHSVPSGGRTRDPFVLMALRVLADAPAPLRARVSAVTTLQGLLTFSMRHGPRLIFGNGVLPHAKWDAVAAVLADPSSRGAAYINVQLPSRPAAQTADPATSGAAGGGVSGLPVNAPPTAATVSTLLDPALIQPSG